MDTSLFLGSVLDGSIGIGAGAYLLCTAASLLLGFLISVFYSVRSTPSRSLLSTVALLPAMVQLVIMLVNGNIGAGIAVMGAFSLVRFRSIPGNARDIAVIFAAMAIGLATGMGFIGIAALFTVIMGLVMLIYSALPLTSQDQSWYELKVTIPESLDYEEAFEEVLSLFCRDHEMVLLKTIDMGSLYQVRYRLRLKATCKEKALLDALRCRNGNLEVAYGAYLFPRETI